MDISSILNEHYATSSAFASYLMMLTVGIGLLGASIAGFIGYRTGVARGDQNLPSTVILSALGGWLVGAVIGALAALITAPTTDGDSRERTVEKISLAVVTHYGVEVPEDVILESLVAEDYELSTFGINHNGVEKTLSVRIDEEHGRAVVYDGQRELPESTVDAPEVPVEKSRPTEEFAPKDEYAPSEQTDPVDENEWHYPVDDEKWQPDLAE